MEQAQGVKPKRRFRDGSTRYKNLVMDCNDIIRVRDNLKQMVLAAKSHINSISWKQTWRTYHYIKRWEHKCCWIYKKITVNIYLGIYFKKKHTFILLYLEGWAACKRDIPQENVGNWCAFQGKMWNLYIIINVMFGVAKQ